MAAPKLPPRPARPRLPAFHPAPAPRAPTVYRWNNSPGLAAAKFPQSAPPVAPYSPPAGSSSTPVSPSGSVLPVDPAYDQQIGALTSQRDTSISGLQSQRAANLLGYGYNEGAGGALTFDPNNAFSKASQLKKRFDESRAGTANNMASRGQLYSGAFQQGQDIQNRAQVQSEDALQKQVLAYLAANTGAQAQARTNYQTGEAQAGADRLGRLATNPLYSPGTADVPSQSDLRSQIVQTYAPFKPRSTPIRSILGQGLRKK